MHLKHPPAKVPMMANLHIFHACISDLHSASYPAETCNMWYNHLTSYSMQNLANSNCRSPGFFSNVLLYTLGMPLIVTINLLLYKVFLIPLRTFYINRLSCNQIDLMSVSSSSHLHQDQRVLLNEWKNEFILEKQHKNHKKIRTLKQ